MIFKTIHYYWFGAKPLPKSVCKGASSWRKSCLITRSRIVERKQLDVNMIPYTQKAYAAKTYAFVSHFARFRALPEYGGVYFNTNVEATLPMDDLLVSSAFMVMERGTHIAPGLGLPVGKGQWGWKPEKSTQTIGGITVYPPEYFCAQEMAGAPIHLAEHSRSIHHLDCTWLLITNHIELIVMQNFPIHRKTIKSLPSKIHHQ